MDKNVINITRTLSFFPSVPVLKSFDYSSNIVIVAILKVILSTVLAITLRISYGKSV